MKSKWYFLIILLIFTTSSVPIDWQHDVPTWDMNKTHSSIKFTVRHLFASITGAFDSFEGKLRFNPRHLAESSANFTIQVASINTNNKLRDRHLLSKTFFYAKKYPSIKFQSKKFIHKHKNHYEIEGKLTIRNITKTIKLPFTFLAAQHNSSHQAHIKSKITISRKAYNVGLGSWAANTIVSDDVVIQIALEFNQKI